MDLISERHGYFKNGLLKIVNQRNYGCLSAFLDKKLNSKGFEFLKEELIDILDDIGLLIDEDILPKKFVLSISYSSVSSFNKWIFRIQNRRYSMISDKKNYFDYNFFLVGYENTHKFAQIESNIVHEKFLYSLYERKKLKKTSIVINMPIMNNELIVYKDYISNETQKICLDNLEEKDLKFEVHIMYARNLKIIEYRIKVKKKKYKASILFNDDGTLTFNYSVWNMTVKKKSSKKKLIKDEKVFDDVLSVIYKFIEKQIVTNKSANVSLGRVGGIQILVNLSVKKYADAEIEMKLIDDEELIILYQGQEIKKFYLTKEPKSNWLISKKK